MIQLTQKIVKSLLTYEPETGFLYWKARTARTHRNGRRLLQWNAKNAGQRAFTAKNTNGYFHGRIHGRLYLAHRVIFLYMIGKIPAEIDHDNRDRTDNRWINLKKSTHTENMKNKTKYSSNTSGTPGVTYNEQTNRWRVRINAQGQRLHVGWFATCDDAVNARLQAEVRYGYKRRN